MENILVKEIKINDYLSVSKLPGADFVINPYIGCTHACRYCYASFMKRFTGHEEKWGTFIDIKRCDKKINIKKLVGKSVFLSSVTDCYNPSEEKYELTRNILKELVNIDCYLSISTKSKLILRDLDLLKEMNNLVVSISINTLDEKFKDDMDCASSIKERIETLKTLYENGIKTVLFMSPIFPYITDFKAIIETTREYTDEYWFENLNLRGDYKKDILLYIKEVYPDYYSEYIDIFIKNNKTYWQDLAAQIKEYCEKEKIKYKNYFYHEEIVKR